MTSGRRPRRRGAALILVMWVFMVLGVIALDFAQYIRDEAQAALNLAEETQAYYAAVGGVHETLERLQHLQRESPLGDAVDEGDDDDGATANVDGSEPEVKAECGGDFSDAKGEIDGIAWEARVCDEAGRIGLTDKAEPLLAAVIRNLLTGGNSVTGVDKRTADDVQTIVDSILDWIDTDSLARPSGAEADYYEDEFGERAPRIDRAFTFPEQLLLVKGMTEGLFFGDGERPGLRDVVSVFNTSGSIHLDRSPVAVVQALCGISKEEASDLKGDATALRACLPADLTDSIEDGDGDAVPAQVSIEVRADPKWTRNRASVALVADMNDGGTPRFMFWLDRAPWSGVRLGDVPPLPGAGT